MKTVFMGASEYGYKCLETLLGIECVDIVGVFTTPESYVLKYEHGTKRKEMQNPMHSKILRLCQESDIPYYVIENMNGADSLDVLTKWQPELIFVSGWYHMIGAKILRLTSKGVVGMHPSLLPRYRGGAPLVWQIINGEKKAGMSLFYFDQGVDTGDVIAQAEVEIYNHDTIKTLYEKVGDQGLRLMKEFLPQISNGTAPRKPQEEFLDSDIWPQRLKKDGLIDWDKSAKEIYDFIRAQTKPYPGAYTIINGKKVTIWDCEVVDIDSQEDVSQT